MILLLFSSPDVKSISWIKSSSYANISGFVISSGFSCAGAVSRKGLAQPVEE